MTTYIRTHGAVGTPLTYSAELASPIPSSGSIGSLRLDRSTSYRSGDRFVVITGGQRYSYYATASTADGAYSNSVPVYPAIQVLHAIGDDVEYKYPGLLKINGMNAVLTVNCNSADVTPAARRLVVPYVTDWPNATDPIGLAWDQSNLLALYLNPISTTGAPESPIPVPRSIDPSYTQFSVRSLGLIGGYYVTGYFGGVIYRNKTSTFSRSQAALRHTFGYYLAEPDATAFPSAQVATYSDPVITGFAAPWQLLRAATEPDSLTTQKATANAVGTRGGAYSFCGFCYDPSTGLSHGFNIEIRALLDGAAIGSAGDVLLHSVAVSSGSPFGSVVTGTWAGDVLPSVGGVSSYYLKGVQGGGGINTFIHLTYASNALIAVSAQVPWLYHVVTGNLHAPGGMINPYT